MQRYPLSWPAGWKRTEPGRRTRAKFNTSRYGANKAQVGVGEGSDRVLRELRSFGVRDGDAIVSTNLQTRLDGLPRADQREPNDPGVCVYWTRPGESGAPKCMAIDRYDRVADNLAAIAATLEAMRAIERHGGAAILDRAFTGFTALPPPMASGKPWREVLGFEGAGSGVTRADVQAAYKRTRSATHPDKGGTSEAFQGVKDAYEQAARELGFQP